MVCRSASVKSSVSAREIHSSRARREPATTSRPASVSVINWRRPSCGSGVRRISPCWSMPARIAAIDCGRTRSAAARSLAETGPPLDSRLSTEVWDGVRSPRSVTSRSLRRRRLKTARSSLAAVIAEAGIPVTSQP